MNMKSASATQRSIWAIIGDVFFSPTKAFEAFKQKPTILVPLILIIILAAGAAALTYQQNAAAQWEMVRTSTTLPPQILQQMELDAQNPSPIGGTIGAGIVVPIMTLIGALVAWFFGSFVFGQKVKYWHVWGVVLLADLIPLAGGLIRSGMVVAKDSIYVSLGPAALMAGKDFTSILYGILYFTDVFAIWGVIVAGFGYAAIFGLSRGKGMTISVIIWIIGLSLFLGFQQIGFAFAGVETSFF